MAIFTSNPIELDKIKSTQRMRESVCLYYIEGNLMALKRILRNLYGVDDFVLWQDSIVYVLKNENGLTQEDPDEWVVIKNHSDN